MTVFGSSIAGVIDSGYDLPEMAKYVDILNVQTYNLHGTWHAYTHHHSPLYVYPEDVTEEDRKLNVVRN